eukprot:m.354399 g.354399  ORF g.354399 m.354399 type:complete len:68 (+) comp17007_c0_seq1:665-868(+)
MYGVASEPSNGILTMSSASFGGGNPKYSVPLRSDSPVYESALPEFHEDHPLEGGEGYNAFIQVETAV